MIQAFRGNLAATRRSALGSLSSQRSQRGMTTLGMIFLVAFIGLIAFGLLRLTPIYLNYMKVAGVVSGLHEEFDSQNASRGAIRTSIGRRFDVESVDVIAARDVKVNSVDGGFEVIAQYEHTTPFIANVYFTVMFDKRTIIRR